MIEDWKADLFREKNLQQVFSASRLLPKSKFNRIVHYISAVISLVVAGFWIATANVVESADAVTTAADLAFNLSVQILGFLIGGFAIFATISDPKLMVKLAQSPMGATGLSVFKYVFFSFLSVFYIYVMTLGISSTIKISSSVKSLDFVYILFGNNSLIIITTFNSVVFLVLITVFTAAVVRLKSFIWNIYQAFITFLITADVLREIDDASGRRKKPAPSAGSATPSANRARRRGA